MTSESIRILTSNSKRFWLKRRSWHQSRKRHSFHPFITSRSQTLSWTFRKKKKSFWMPKGHNLQRFAWTYSGSFHVVSWLFQGFFKKIDFKSSMDFPMFLLGIPAWSLMQGFSIGHRPTCWTAEIRCLTLWDQRSHIWLENPPCSIGNISTQSGAPIFQPAMLVDPGV